MTLARKKELLYGGLVLFTLWPLAQLELVRRFEISPWKLAGWGMYAMPRIAPGIGILVLEPGHDTPAPLKAVPPEVRVEADAYQMRRLWLRKLAPPDRLGRLVLESNPSYRRATILVIELKVDAQTGMVRAEESTYDYEPQT